MNANRVAPRLFRRAGVLALAPRVLAQSRTASPGRNLVYIASYSSPQAPEGSEVRGHGIRLFGMDSASGLLSLRDVVPNHSNPSWLGFNPQRTILYSGE